MNEQDMINLILGEPEDDFHGTVPSKDKRLRRVVIRNSRTEFTIVQVQDWIDQDDTLEL